MLTYYLLSNTMFAKTTILVTVDINCLIEHPRIAYSPIFNTKIIINTTRSYPYIWV